MKSGYKKLLVFQIFFIVLFCLNNFVSSILSGYIKIAFLLGILLLFKLFFGFEKDNQRYWKTICIEIIICLLIYFILYYLSGIFISFARTNIVLNWKTISKDVLPLVLTIILQEYLRYSMLRKSEGSKLLLVTTCLFFAFLYMLGTCSSATFLTPYSSFRFIALVLLPTISANIFCSYVSYKAGYKPAIMYLLISELYIYIVPIIPDPNEYIYSVVQLIAPALYLYHIYRFYKKDRDDDEIDAKQKKSIFALVIPIILVGVLVYFTSGYFHFHAISVGSGSMTPNILKGDAVIIEKSEGKFAEIEIGQVIAYKKDDRIIVHRLINKVYVDGEYFFYTKGDANENADNYQITESMMIGVVRVKIPYIGYPAVWLNDL